MPALALGQINIRRLVVLRFLPTLAPAIEGHPILLLLLLLSIIAWEIDLVCKIALEDLSWYSYAREVSTFSFRCIPSVAPSDRTLLSHQDPPKDRMTQAREGWSLVRKVQWSR